MDFGMPDLSDEFNRARFRYEHDRMERNYNEYVESEYRESERTTEHKRRKKPKIDPDKHLTESGISFFAIHWKSIFYNLIFRIRSRLISDAISSMYKIPKPPSNHLENEWVDAALQEIGMDQNTTNPPKDVFEMNRRITIAYARMYKNNRRAFKWSGLAAFASHSVGRGMGNAYGYAIGEAAVSLSDVLVAKKMLKLLSEGNLAVYSDIYWQHLAFQKGGLEELRKYLKKGLSEASFQSWKKIAEGIDNNNDDLIWEGNSMLLEYEQKIILQKRVYDKDRGLWKTVSRFPTTIFHQIESPVPEIEKSFQEYTIGERDDLGDFDQRWSWIINEMTPDWKEFEKDQTKVDRYLEKITK